VSRRRPGRQVPPSAGIPFPVKVVCTDRGQHARIVLHQLHDLRGSGIGLQPVVPAGGGRNGIPLSFHADDGVLRYRFGCPRCGRDVQLREASLLAAVGVLGASHGHPVLDISLLPC
jgi:hypothetical protein